jgi:hypothetical protein
MGDEPVTWWELIYQKLEKIHADIKKRSKSLEELSHDLYELRARVAILEENKGKDDELPGRD